jgi:membrane protease YdiL (CAAX protease family)
MGTKSLAYLALSAYPFITLLVYEPNELRWWWRTGGGVPMPPEMMERSKRNEGNLLLFKFALLIIASFFFLRGGLDSPASLGLRLRQPTGTVLIGVLGGILLAGEVRAMLALAKKWSPRTGEVPIFVVRESTWRILAILVFGAFAEEFWRALALTSLIHVGTSTESAVLLTSLSFGLGHVLSYQSLGAALGRALRPAFGGVFLAALFLWSGTLVTPFIAHVLLNSTAALMQRKRALVKQDSRASDSPG